MTRTTKEHIQNEIAKAQIKRDYHLAMLKLVDERLAKWRAALAATRQAIQESKANDN